MMRTRQYELTGEALGQLEYAFHLLSHLLIAIAECGNALEGFAEVDRQFAETIPAEQLRMREKLLRRSNWLMDMFFDPTQERAQLISMGRVFGRALDFGNPCPFTSDEDADRLLYALWHNSRRVPTGTEACPPWTTEAIREAHAAVLAHIRDCPACGGEQPARFIVQLCHEGRQLHAILDQAVAAASRPPIELDWPSS